MQNDDPSTRVTAPPVMPVGSDSDAQAPMSLVLLVVDTAVWPSHPMVE